jgi:hypothetical protein
MPRINVFITIDTEHSIGGAFSNRNLKPVGNEKRVWGKIGDKSFGIPLMMDIAEAFDIRLTFFVEVLNKYYFGEGESKKVCEYIANRGHDVQLHMHPNYLNFITENPQEQRFSDIIGTYELKKQIEFLDEGIKTLVRNGIPRPVAFRAGCFGANQDTLKALKEVGILIDSSYNRAFLQNPCLLEDNGTNDLTHQNGIWKFPITNFIESTKLRTKRFMPMDINGVDFCEMKFVLNQTKTKGPANITIILHSFSFIKPYDVQYNKVRPRWNVIRRFRKLCQYVSENSDLFEVKTFGSLDQEKLATWSLESIHFFPKVPPIFSIMRGFQQLKDNLI